MATIKKYHPKMLRQKMHDPMEPVIFAIDKNLSKNLNNLYSEQSAFHSLKILAVPQKN